MKLSIAFLKEILSYDAGSGHFTYKVKRGRMNPGDRAGSVDMNGYCGILINKKEYKQHRLAWFYVYGEWPDGDIDHINGDRTDNRIANLRPATDALNTLNKSWESCNRAGFRGVSWHKTERSKGKWRVRITANGVRKSIGNFDSLEEAISARICAENEFYGEFAPSRGCMVGATAGVSLYIGKSTNDV
jgi:hypothetical protein